jgi:iron complex outermembrane recepter protein
MNKFSLAVKIQCLSVLAFLFTTTLLNAQQSTGSVSGTVKTSDGHAAEFVNVGLLGTSIGTYTNSTGAFQLDHIKAGSYTLVLSFIGLETKEVQIEVKPSETTVVPEISLKENSKELKEIIITGNKSINEKPVEIGKIGIKPLDLPQSVSYIDKEVIEQQQTLRMSDALKNFNGVYLMGNSGGYQEEIAGRGFAFGSSNTFKNGVRFNNTAMPEMNSLERVEVMKGSTAILFGNVAAGGVLNLITKKPMFEKGGEVSFRTGSYDLYRPSVDIYGSVNDSKHVAFRINSTYEKSRSFRDIVKSERYYINPSLLFKIAKKTDLLIEGDFMNDNRTADFGVGAIDYQLIDIPRSRFIGVEWSYFKVEQQSVTATVTHHLTDKWKIKAVAGMQSFKSDLFANQRPNANNQFVKTNGDWVRGLQRTKVNEDYSIAQIDLIGKFTTASVQHNLLLGVEGDKYETNNLAYNSQNKYDTVNVFDPNKFRKRNDIPNLTARSLTTSPSNRAGAYIQDLVSITSQIKLLAGVRFSYLETFSNVLTYSTDKTVATKQYDQAISPRVGVVYQPFRSTAVFVSYSNSFTPNTGVDITGKALAPSVIDQYEAGIKNDFFNGLFTANATVYRILNSNLAQISLENGNTDANIKELAGEVKSEGVEVDLVSKTYKGFSMIGGYSFNETKYTKSNTYIVGSLLRYNPNHTANLTLNYSFAAVKALKGFNIGVSGLYIGERWGGRSTRVTVKNDSFKLIRVPEYTQLDGSIGYSLKSISVRVKVSNILDVMSYNVHDDNSVNPIAPRLFAGTFTYRF